MRLFYDYMKNIKNSLKYHGDFAVEVALQAGHIIKTDFELYSNRTKKSDGSFITNTDKKINSFLIHTIRKEFPETSILSEEGSHIKRNSKYVWVCDPLDGTIAFLSKVPTSSFSIALVENGTPVLGVIYNPFTDRMYFASIESETIMNNQRVFVSKEKKLKGTVVGMSYWTGAQTDLFKVHKNLVDCGTGVLMPGSIVYNGVLVASGEFSASIHPARYPYDSAALKIIISQAGGVMTDLSGNEQRYDKKINGAVMCNPFVQKELIKVIRDYKE